MPPPPPSERNNNNDHMCEGVGKEGGEEGRGCAIPTIEEEAACLYGMDGRMACRQGKEEDRPLSLLLID